MKCPKCGEENKRESNFCSSCGEKLETAKKNKKKQNSGEIAPVQNSVGREQISKTTVYQVITALLVLVFINLFFAGIFDEPTAEISTQDVSADPHAGVDLSKLDELKSLEAKVNSNPADYVSMLELARSYSEAGFVQKAIESFEKYLRGKDNNMVRLEFSHFLHDNAQWQKAIDNYEIYLKAFPKNADVLVDQGVCYFSLRDYDNAIEVMQKALQYDKTHLFAHFNLGIVNINAGNTEKGIEWMKKVIELEPGSQMAKQAQEIIDSNNKGG